MLTKAKTGVRLRRFREERGLTQAALAEALGISPSYVNQMESNQRPITAPVLFKLASVYDIDVQQFATDEADRLMAQLRDIVTDSTIGESITVAEIRELAQAMPSVARHLIELDRRYRHLVDLNTNLSTRIEGRQTTDVALPLSAYEEVRDLFYAYRNHFPELDAAAEALFVEADLTVGDTAPGIADVLRKRHGVTIVDLDPGSGEKRRFDPSTRTLAVSRNLAAGQRAFQMATQLALCAVGDLIDAQIATASLSSEETRLLARIGLAHYFAGALICPYGTFLETAEALRYDIDLLGNRFGVGYETVAHRLSTLQRPGAKGVPFFFVRVDRAGNISKRQSATDFHFSRVGGTCPLWNVYEAFAYPGRISTQLATMPDGRGYLWIARTVTRRTGGYGTPAKSFAIGLGCDTHHAPRVVYADGLDLTNPSAFTPIGPGCKVCDRPACPQRAAPPVGAPLDIDDHRSGFLPYPIVGNGDLD